MYIIFLMFYFSLIDTILYKGTQFNTKVTLFVLQVYVGHFNALVSLGFWLLSFMNNIWAHEDMQTKTFESAET